MNGKLKYRINIKLGNLEMRFMLILIIFCINTSLYAEFGPWETTLVKKEKSIKKTEDKNYSTLGWVFIRFIRFFQIVISPQDGPNCRYHPTCSQYALISIKEYGPVVGLVMSADRYLRCNPLGAWGTDLPAENYFWNTAQTNIVAGNKN